MELGDLSQIEEVSVFDSGIDGPRLIVLGAVHGNEIAGSKAILKIMDEIKSKALSLKCGQVTFVPVTNRLAYQKNNRSGDRNLNRNLYPKENPQDNEDHIANWLCPLLAKNDVLLDLHSFLAQGIPFALIGPHNNNGDIEPFQYALEEETLVQNLGISRYVYGWLDTYTKAVSRRAERQGNYARNDILNDVRYGVGSTEFMRSSGGYAITLECGQHEDPNAPAVAYKAIKNTLATLRITDEAIERSSETSQCWQIYEVVDREHEKDGFIKVWKSFDPVQKGELIGKRHDGQEIYAPEDGCILFPSAGGPVGQEWMYFARLSNRI